MDMNIRITMTHYQYPAAVRDLKEWEMLFWDRIVYKNRINKEEMVFIVMHQTPEGQPNNYEIVYCTPINLWMTETQRSVSKEALRIQDIIERLVGDFFDERFPGNLSLIEYTWNKHVIYGSVFSGQLLWLAEFAAFYENELTELGSQSERDLSGHGNKQIVEHGE